MDMKIKEIYLPYLSHGEHKAFHDHVITVVEEFTAATLDVEVVFEEYKKQFADENKAFMPMRKSATTAHLAAAHKRRGNIYRGLKFAVKSAGFHFNPEKEQAAHALKIVLNKFGNIKSKAYNEATAAAMLLANVCNKNYASEVALLGLGEWIAKLETVNTEFTGLMQSRNTERAQKTKLRMSKVRPNVDAAYHSLTERINALVEINGEEAYAPFIKRINVRIDKLRLTLAQHKGRLAKKRREKNSTPVTEEPV